MAKSKKRPVPPCQAATGLPHTKTQLGSYDMTDTAAPTLRQVPVGVIRLASRFGMSVSAAQAVAEANRWGAH